MSTDRKGPLRLIGRKDANHVFDRGAAVLIGTVFSGDTGIVDASVEVYKSNDVSDRAGFIFVIESDANGGYVPHVECTERRLVLHQAGEFEAELLADLIRVASILAKGKIDQSIAEAERLGVGLNVSIKVPSKRALDLEPI